MKPSTKTVSAGVLIVNDRGEVFLAHPTHSPKWNLPKGMIEQGESPIVAAIREAKEEIGVSFSPSDLIDAGRYSYLPKKDLHLFVVQVSKEELDPNDCYCDSTFELYGKTFPEMDGYMWVPLNKVSQYCTNVLTSIINAAIQQTLGDI